MVARTSGQGNCNEKAVAESSFCLLKEERIKPRILPDRYTARADVFDPTQGFYKPTQHYSFARILLPADLRANRPISGTGKLVDLNV